MAHLEEHAPLPGHQPHVPGLHKRAAPAARELRGSQKRQRSKSILHFTCLPLALTLTARCSWLSSSVRAAPGKGFWKMIMLSMTPCSTSSVHSSRCSWTASGPRHPGCSWWPPRPPARRRPTGLPCWRGPWSASSAARRCCFHARPPARPWWPGPPPWPGAQLPAPARCCPALRPALRRLCRPGTGWQPRCCRRLPCSPPGPLLARTG